MTSAKDKPTRQKAVGRAPASGDLVLLGEFGRAHGLKGEVRLKSFTADPAVIADYRPLFGDDGRSFIITSIRQAAGTQPDLLVVRVEGVSDRDQAEALNRIKLHIERSRLPAAEDEDEFLYTDLIGLNVVDGDNQFVGIVQNVSDYGSGDILEVKPAEGETILVPFTKAFVPTIDIAAGRIVVDYTESADDSDVDEENRA